VTIVKEESLQFQLILFIIKKFNIVLAMYYKQKLRIMSQNLINLI